MTIRLLMQYRDYPINSIISLDAATESGLILAKMAEANLTGGLTYIKPLLLNQKYNAEIQLNPNTGDVQGLVNPKTGGIMRHAKTRIIASFGGFKNQGTQFSNATTQLSATDRVRVIPWADANNIQAVMINGSSISNGKISAPGNAVMIAVSIENGASPYPQFSFRNNSGVKANTDIGGGRTAHYIGDGEITISEPMAYPLLTSNTNYIHSYHKVAAGEKFPTTGIPNINEGNQTTDTVWGTTVVNGQDNTASYQSMGNYAAGGYGFYPQAILGTFLNPIPVTLIAGDSLAGGDAGGTGAYLGKSYVHVALDAAGLKYHNNGIGGCSMQSWSGNQTYIGLLGQYVDTVAWVMGTNDIANNPTLAQMQNYLYQCLARFAGNPRIILHTLPPRPASSSNGWTTIAGQTLAAFESARVSYNNWLRSAAIAWGKNLGLNIAGVNDVCLGVEYNLDGTAMTLVNKLQNTSGANTGGYWIANATTDGIHPNNLAIDLMKLNIDVSSNNSGLNTFN